LKAEVNILKRSLEEEKEARKFGDYFSAEAILQLQTALGLDLTQHLTSENKLRQVFEAEMSREISNSKQTLEDKLSHHKIVSKELRAFRLELDREFRNRFEQFDRRFEEGQHKFKNLSNAVLSRSAHESGTSEVMNGLNDERGDSHWGGVWQSPQKVTVLEEQTDSVDEGAVDDAATMTKESVRRRIASWEVRGTSDHEITTETAGCMFEKETTCSWDLLKTFDQDVVTEQTDCVVEEEKPCCVGSAIST